jgi:hypothetical protein
MKFHLEVVRCWHFLGDVRTVEVMQTVVVTVAMNETASWEQMGYDKIPA